MGVGDLLLRGSGGERLLQRFLAVHPSVSVSLVVVLIMVGQKRFNLRPCMDKCNEGKCRSGSRARRWPGFPVVCQP